MTSPQRPIFLNLLQIHLPITAWVSIAHRISGVALSLFLPFLIFPLHDSLISQEHFDSIVHLCSQSLYVRGIALVVALSFLYHMLAGIRHLIMDLKIGLSLQIAKVSAWTLIAMYLSAILFFYSCCGGV